MSFRLFVPMLRHFQNGSFKGVYEGYYKGLVSCSLAPYCYDCSLHVELRLHLLRILPGCAFTTDTAASAPEMWMSTTMLFPSCDWHYSFDDASLLARSLNVCKSPTRKPCLVDRTAKVDAPNI